MRVAVTEGPVFWVDALVAALRARGDEVVHLTRTPRTADDRRWDPPTGTIEAPGLTDVDAVVNLYGASPVQRWSESFIDLLRETRITGTLTIVSNLEPDGRCQRFLNRSSTAFYGNSEDEEVTADSPRGKGHLAKAASDWEYAARHAAVSTALLRTPAIIARGEGYLVGRRGWLRGRIGDGHQFIPWIHVEDWVAAVLFLLGNHTEGPINVCAPDPVREGDLVAALAKAQGRRPGIAVPDAVLNARYGKEAAVELWKTSTRAMPGILRELGFEHRFGTIEAALADAVGPESR